MSCLRKTVFSFLRIGKLASHTIENDSLNLYILLESEEKWQYTNSSGFAVKSNGPDNGPCLPTFNSSANHCGEKQFWQYEIYGKLASYTI